MLSQFNPNPGYPEQRTLVKTDLPEGFLPIGRLDYDSEGLLLLSDDPRVERELLLPEKKHPRAYLVQVAGVPSESSLEFLRSGGLEIRVNKKSHLCAPVEAKILPHAPEWLWERSPPVDASAAVKSSWLQLTLTEGKNRQVRRMTAKIGHPTLRLVRTDIMDLAVKPIPPLQWVMRDEI